MCVCVLQRTRATQIIPCTVSQLMSASQADEAFKVGDVEIAQVRTSKEVTVSSGAIALGLKLIIIIIIRQAVSLFFLLLNLLASKGEMTEKYQ